MIFSTGSGESKGNTDLLDIAQARSGLEMYLYIKAGADPNSASLDGKSLLMITSEINNNPQVVTTLVNAGAVVDAELYGWTPIFWAARSNQNPEVLLALIDEGADLSRKDSRGLTPLMVAALYNQNPEVVFTLLYSYDFNTGNKKNESNLHNLRSPYLEKDLYINTVKKSDFESIIKSLDQIEQYLSAYEVLFDTILNIRLNEYESIYLFVEKKILMKYNELLIEIASYKPDLWETDSEFKKRIKDLNASAFLQMKSSILELKNGNENNTKNLLEFVFNRKSEITKEIVEIKDNLKKELRSPKILGNDHLTITPLEYERNKRVWPFQITVNSDFLYFSDFLLELDLTTYSSIRDTVLDIDNAIKSNTLVGEISLFIDYNPSTQLVSIYIERITLNNTNTDNEFVTFFSPAKTVQTIKVTDFDFSDSFQDVNIEGLNTTNLSETSNFNEPIQITPKSIYLQNPETHPISDFSIQYFEKTNKELFSDSFSINPLFSMENIDKSTFLISTKNNPISDFEHIVCNTFQLDLFSIKTQVLQNIVIETLSNSQFQTLLANPIVRYFDNFSVFLGKKIYNDVFLQAKFQLLMGEQYISSFLLTDDIGLDIELSLEWKNPLCILTLVTDPYGLQLVQLFDALNIEFSWSYLIY